MCYAQDIKTTYDEDLAYIDSLIASRVGHKELLETIMHCYDKHDVFEYKAHFHFLFAAAMKLFGQIETAYQFFIKTDMSFPKTSFGQSAADVIKQMFLRSKGQLSPIPMFVPKIQIETTNQCYLDCIMCGRNKNRPLGQMSLDRFKKIVDQSLLLGAHTFILDHMGEPLLNSYLTEFIKYLSDAFMSINLNEHCMERKSIVTTNGLLLNEENLHSLMSAGLGCLSISIDGRNADEYEKIRPGASYHIVMKNLKLARQIRDNSSYSTKINVVALDRGMDQGDNAYLQQYYIGKGADSFTMKKTICYEKRQVTTEMGQTMQNQSVSDDVLDYIVVLWDGQVQSEIGEEKNQDLILGHIDHNTLLECYLHKMQRLGFVVEDKKFLVVQLNQYLAADQSNQNTGYIH